jgi:hypothetical protein
MYDRLVFVEAPSDENIIREWSSKIGVNLSQANVGFIAMGGARDLNYFAAETTLTFLTRRQVKLWFLVDRDERESADIKKLERALGGRAIIKVLNRREMENYLVCPRAIIKFIELKRSLSARAIDGILPTEADVKMAIEEAGDKVKGFAVHKRMAKDLCRPIYPRVSAPDIGGEKAGMIDAITKELESSIDALQGVKEKVEEVYERHQEAVDTHWETHKLSVVPGDLLIDMVCSKYGVRFRKERDGLRLASLMCESEIQEEIKAIIKEIGT